MRKQEIHPRTEIINKKQKNLSKKARQEALSWLAKKFPAAFDNTQTIRPLKKGIMQDILKYVNEAKQDGISISKLREAVVIYTRRIDYLITLKAREMRVDLEGNADILVSEEEAGRAAQKIKKRVEKSVKNARKNLSNVTTCAKAYTHQDYNKEQNYFESNKVANKPPLVTIKTKSTRNFDPNAVTRLKEKLGLVREKETV